MINGLRGTAEAEAEAEAAVAMVTSQAIASQNEAMNYLKQCDQMVKLIFNIWPFATMKFSPIM